MQYFETIFLEEVDKFLGTLDKKTKKKVIFNTRVAEQTNDPELFKKLNSNIWEFKSKYLGKQIRLLAFWDKTDSEQTLVLATHGFLKRHKKHQEMKLKELRELELLILRKKKLSIKNT